MIRNVVIVGGGSAGWMTAAAFERLLPEYNVTLVESPDVPITGVGESTLGHINMYMCLLGLKDEEWMADCEATHKVGIRFTDFYKKDGTHWDYPFVDPSNAALPGGLVSFWALRNAYPEKYSHPNSFARMINGNTLLMEENRIDDSGKWGDMGTDYSYHMDAVKFGQWLKNNVGKNVKYVQGHVMDADFDEQGNIERLHLDTNVFLKADLFVDCTGFKSVLLEGLMGSKHIPFNDILPNNKATVCRIPHHDASTQIVNYTNCTALGNGWVWKVPLWTRSGTGYVWCDKFQNESGAEQEFREHLAKHHTNVPDDFRVIDLRSGKHEKAWVKNVVGVGLSYGFLEPLESTGLLTVHEQIRRLIETLQTRGGVVSSIEKAMFNNAADREIDGFADFIAWHYAFSMRRDTAYWRYVTEEIDYAKNHFAMNHPEDNPFRLLTDCKYVKHEFPEEFTGDLYVLAGNDFATLRGQGQIITEKRFGTPPVAQWDAQVDSHMYCALEYIKQLPTSYEYLRDTIYAVS